MSNKQKAEEIFKGMMIKPPYHQYQIIGAMEHIAEWKEHQICEKLMKFISDHFFNHPNQYRVVCSESFISVSDLMEKIKQEIEK